MRVRAHQAAGVHSAGRTPAKLGSAAKPFSLPVIASVKHTEHPQDLGPAINISERAFSICTPPNLRQQTLHVT